MLRHNKGVVFADKPDACSMGNTPLQERGRIHTDPSPAAGSFPANDLEQTVSQLSQPCVIIPTLGFRIAGHGEAVRPAPFFSRIGIG